MTFKGGRAYALAATAVVFATFAAPANATTITWTFDSGNGAAPLPLRRPTTPTLPIQVSPYGARVRNVRKRYDSDLK